MNPRIARSLRRPQQQDGRRSRRVPPNMSALDVAMFTVLSHAPNWVMVDRSMPRGSSSLYVGLRRRGFSCSFRNVGVGSLRSRSLWACWPHKIPTLDLPDLPGDDLLVSFGEDDGPDAIGPFD